MNLLSKVSYYKINFLATRIEIRSSLNVLGLCSDKNTERKNRDDLFEVISLAMNLKENERQKIQKRVSKYDMKDED